MKDYRDLEVWRRSHDLVLAVYRASQCFPNDERFGLTSQLRRSAASIPANLAEGCGRHSDAELARYVEISHGSASETEYHLLLARDLGFLEAGAHESLADEVGQIKRMLGSLFRRLRPASSDNS
ncbi:four helix bundle protein [Actomonas aquatica]|uniref:Four helix bundle protein n=1 Tax=Actomonas aquatica TaxID=2866162 RepID=A0ABZ1CC23_9BACT|nr:four helix bundle protein [Opitutus sp. WL0086]WRQ88134.1 four helix bundle protein [Opitutus sp. WL0086]